MGDLLIRHFAKALPESKRRPPLFFRGLESPGEILYRPFQELADIRQVETLLAQLPRLVWSSSPLGCCHQGPHRKG